MPANDDIARHNRRRWTEWVANGEVYTRPWLELKRETVHAYAQGELDVLPEPYRYIYPQFILKDVTGRDVLCLASGGGQQSVVFGLLGAKVTVLDLTEAQLAGDRKAARHHGYNITATQGDMRDLSRFPAASFDLVYQAISLCFVPDVGQVYREVARVLRPGGYYRAGHCNPATNLAEHSSWDGQGYRISEPYVGGRLPDKADEPIEFRHLFSEIFNGLVEAGLAIQGVWEDPRHLVHDQEPEPGTFEHWLTFVQDYFCVVAQKSETRS